MVCNWTKRCRPNKRAARPAYVATSLFYPTLLLCRPRGHHLIVAQGSPFSRLSAAMSRHPTMLCSTQPMNSSLMPAFFGHRGLSPQPAVLMALPASQCAHGLQHQLQARDDKPPHASAPAHQSILLTAVAMRQHPRLALGQFLELGFAAADSLDCCQHSSMDRRGCCNDAAIKVQPPPACEVEALARRVSHLHAAT